MTPYTLPLEAQRQAIERAGEFVERAAVAPDRAQTMAEIEVGTTPSEVVYRENKLELLHYESEAEETHDVPVLIVYALINRPYILDLQPSRSVVRRLLEGGFDVYLIDWGEPTLLDASLTLHDYVDRYVDNCVDVVRERTGSETVSLLGYCMGGTMSAMYAARHPEKVQNLALMAAGLYFEDTGGVLELWGDDDYFDPQGLSDTYGTVPADFFDVGFQLMDPVSNTVSKYVRLYENLEDEDFVENFARMERWLDDGIDMAGETYAQFIRDIYQENALYEDELTLDGEPVDLSAITMPVLQIVGTYDHLVPPASSKPFNDAVASEDTEIMQADVGHIGLSVSSRSHEELWPAVCEWLAERSVVEDETDLERVDGIGPSYAQRLREAGVETLTDLADADAVAIGEQIDVGESRVADWVEQAATLTE